MSFGRKGVGQGAAAPAGVRPAMRLDPQAAAMAARREAFVAEERARPAAQEHGTADPLAALRNGARPASPARPATSQADPYAAQREAFLAAERARAASASASGDNSYDYAAATRRQTSPGARYLLGDPRKRNLLWAYFFWYFCGGIGLHRVYCGHKESAVYQVVLLLGSLGLVLVWPPIGVFGLVVWAVWLFADLFLIPGMMRRFKAAHEEDIARSFA